MRANWSIGVVGAVLGALFGIALGWSSRGIEMSASAPGGGPSLSGAATAASTPGAGAVPTTLSEARERIVFLDQRIAEQAQQIEDLRLAAGSSADAKWAPPAAGETTGTGPSAAPSQPGASDSVPSSRSPVEVLRRIDEIKEEIAEAFESGDGKRALSLLRELGNLGPQAYDLAIALARRIDKDVEGDNTLNLSRIALQKIIGSPDFVPLLQHAVTSPGVDRAFRQAAAGALVWKNAPETTALFLKQLAVEKDDRLFRQMADAVAELREPASVTGLIELFARRPERPAFRLALIGAIEELNDPMVDQKLQALSTIDTDAKVRTAARVAYVGRNAPEAGYLVSGVADKTQASKIGLQPGDIIVRYNDQPLGSDKDLGRLVRGVPGNQTVSLLVLRNGQYQTFGIKGGKIGVDGRGVKPKASR